MKPAPFEYFRPQTLDEALALLAAHGSDAKPLAGGQSLIPAMNFRLATPAVLVDLNAVADLAYITAAEENAASPGTAASIRIGAMTRQRELERNVLVRRHVPLVTEAMPHIAHPAIRTRGTLGGSLAHADPAAELPAVMLTLNASLTLTNQHGSRAVPADEFFVGLFSTAAAPGELLTEVSVSAPGPRTAYAFQEVSRRHGDFALAGVAVMLGLDEAGRVATARIALLSVADRPVLATHAAAAVIGQPPSPESTRAAADAAAERDVDPPGDIHASSRYRRHLVRVLTHRALDVAAGRLRAEG
jgi:CO/xanthine dehydrogenase FAD-binding subunit